MTTRWKVGNKLVGVKNIVVGNKKAAPACVEKLNVAVEGLKYYCEQDRDQE